MKVMIRLYKRYDIDLLSLYHNSGFKFKKEFKKSIRNYARKTQEMVPLPKPNIHDVFDYNTVAFQVVLNSQKDADVIAFIKSIKSGYRNCVLKNIFRNSLQGVYLFTCCDAQGIEESNCTERKVVERNVIPVKKEEILPKETISPPIKREEVQEEIAMKTEPIVNVDVPKSEEESVDDSTDDIFAMAGNMFDSMY